MKINYTTNVFSILSTISIFAGVSLLAAVVYARQGQTGATIESPPDFNT
jgi:hypothetical protein